LIATSGGWQGKRFSLKGGFGRDRNHAKLGVSLTGNFVYFGDLNQQGAYSPGHGRLGCGASQNGRGGLFFVIEDESLHRDVAALLEGGTAPLRGFEAIHVDAAAAPADAIDSAAALDRSGNAGLTSQALVFGLCALALVTVFVSFAIRSVGGKGVMRSRDWLEPSAEGVTSSDYLVLA
jgi:hypothetical protein